jgi:hypothetical protein
VAEPEYKKFNYTIVQQIDMFSSIKMKIRLYSSSG